MVEGVGIDFRNTGAQEGAHEELEALELGLDDDEAEIGFGVGVARLLFHKLDLFKIAELYISQMRSSLDRANIPAYLFSLELAPSRHPAMA